MKKLYVTLLTFVFTGIAAFAQKMPDTDMFKKRTDSTYREGLEFYEPLPLPGPKIFMLPNSGHPKRTNTFQKMNPGATVINITGKGTIYNMPLDNMAVLAPDMKQVKKMPGVLPVAPENMPNPMQQPDQSKRKQ